MHIHGDNWSLHLTRAPMPLAQFVPPMERQKDLSQRSYREVERSLLMQFESTCRERERERERERGSEGVREGEGEGERGRGIVGGRERGRERRERQTSQMPKGSNNLCRATILSKAPVSWYKYQKQDHEYHQLRGVKMLLFFFFDT